MYYICSILFRYIICVRICIYICTYIKYIIYIYTYIYICIASIGYRYEIQSALTPESKDKV